MAEEFGRAAEQFLSSLPAIEQLADDAPVFVISIAAQLAGMHPQTLRQYDRVGLVTPGRTTGGGRRYSAHNIAVLRMVQRLSQDEGINLAGIKRIIDLENQVNALQGRVRELLSELAAIQQQVTIAEAAVHASYRRDLVPFRTTGGTIVPWRRR